MKKDSLMSVTDGHIELTKPAGGGGAVSSQPSGEKLTFAGSGDMSKSGFRKVPYVAEFGSDSFTCRKSTDIPFASFRK